MNKQRISSYNELLEEEVALRRRLAIQRANVAEHWDSVKQQFAPAAKLISSVGKFTSGRGKGLLATGFNVALGLLFRKTGAPVIRNMATGYVAEKAAGWIAGIFRKKKKLQ